MKKHLSAVVATLLAIMMLALMLTACGDSKPADATVDNTPAATEEETTAAEPKEITGQTAEWGAYTVLVPDEFELAEGGEFSAYDFAVKKSDFTYFDFNTEADDELMMQHYNYNKSTYTNDQKDVEATYGSSLWTGFQYSDGFGGYGFEAYSTLGEKIVRVSCAGFTFDSDEAEAVLGSLALK